MSTYLQKQIEDRMESQDLNIHALERKAGLNRSAVRNILQGFSKNPSMEILKAIATALDCTLEDLIDPSDNRAMPKSTIRAVVKAGGSYIWKKQLYLEAVNTISELALDKRLSPGLDQITFLINESYRYSISNDLDHIDQNFCKWLFTKNF